MMNPEFENFVLIPHSNSKAEGKLYELDPCSEYSESAFVLLPYQNPQVQKILPRFYKVHSSKDIPLVSRKKPPHILLKARTTKENYIQKINALKQEIQRGNIYEINYCIEFFCEQTAIDPLAVFSELNSLAKAPYSILLKENDNYIISASPELFLKKEGQHLSTKPIKGTIRRGENREEDLALKQELETNIKERTENVMAVDVARNDLSRVAQKGTVHVNKLYNIETFETVHQMVSTVSCEIKGGISFENILDATFPMASMTGAPKLRAMQLIDQYEDFKRNSYSGAMGFIDEKGDYTLSVIIRSIFYNQKTNQLSIAVGGAITYLSDPEKEYEECLLKANALLKALNASIEN